MLKMIASHAMRDSTAVARERIMLQLAKNARLDIGVIHKMKTRVLSRSIRAHQGRRLPELQERLSRKTLASLAPLASIV